jgi:hypothetical protein
MYWPDGCAVAPGSRCCWSWSLFACNLESADEPTAVMATMSSLRESVRAARSA